jgi:hypothetical protein
MTEGPPIYLIRLPPSLKNRCAVALDVSGRGWHKSDEQRKVTFNLLSGNTVDSHCGPVLEPLILNS